jgi:hypothetical protein
VKPNVRPKPGMTLGCLKRHPAPFRVVTAMRY